MKETTYATGSGTGNYSAPEPPPGEEPRVIQAIAELGKEVVEVKEAIVRLKSRVSMVSDLEDVDDIWNGIVAEPPRASSVRMEAWIYEILEEVRRCRVALVRVTNSLHI